MGATEASETEKVYPSPAPSPEMATCGSAPGREVGVGTDKDSSQDQLINAVPISRPKTSLPPMATRPKQSTHPSSHRDSQALQVMQPVISANLDTFVPRAIKQPLIASRLTSVATDATGDLRRPGHHHAQENLIAANGHEANNQPTPHCRNQPVGQQL